MRSSGSTRSPRREPAIRLYLVRIGDDHPKACTGLRILRRGLARPPPRDPDRNARPVLLDPHADRPLSPADRAAAETGGLVAVDCSWNRLAERGGYPRDLGVRGTRRRLPWLLAANPQHFGRLAELNTAEALAAGLYLLGEVERARGLLADFPGGPGFFELNGPALEAYRSAGDDEGVRTAERRSFGQPPPS